MKRTLLFALLVTLSCAKPHHASKAFETEEMKWRAERRTKLTGDNSWLTLVGLTWLHEGDNDVPLANHPTADGQALNARITLQGGKATLQPNSNLLIDGKPV